jgi:hypothetical protein
MLCFTPEAPRLSCRTFRDNVVRLQLFALTYNPANFLRSLGICCVERGAVSG